MSEAVEEATRALVRDSIYGDLLGGDPYALGDLARFVIDAATPVLAEKIRAQVRTEIFQPLPPIMREMLEKETT